MDQRTFPCNPDLGAIERAIALWEANGHRSVGSVVTENVTGLTSVVTFEDTGLDRPMRLRLRTTPDMGAQLRFAWKGEICIGSSRTSVWAYREVL